MEVQRRIILLLHIFLSFCIHTQILAVDPLNQASLSSVDLKPHILAVETMSFPVDLERRELAGGGGSRGGSSGGSSGGGGSRGGGGSGGSGGKGGNGRGTGGRGGGGRGGNSGNSGGGGGRQAPVFSGGNPSDSFRNQYSLRLFIFTTCLVIMYH